MIFQNPSHQSGLINLLIYFEQKGRQMITLRNPLCRLEVTYRLTLIMAEHVVTLHFVEIHCSIGH